MKSSLRIGRSVIHRNYGKGVVGDLGVSGYAKVHFSDESIYVRLEDIREDPDEIRAEKELERLREIEEERIALQKAEAERIRQEEIRRQEEEKKQILFKKIRHRFETDFLSADSLYVNSYTDTITRDDYEHEKREFVRSWLENNLPSNNGKRQLPDSEQISAISRVNGHVQVIARAGSGKTATLSYRTFFLLRHCRIAPSEILILAFNHKAALEVRRRLLAMMHADAEASVSKEVNEQFGNHTAQRRIRREDVEANAVDKVAEKLGVVLPHIMTFHALAYAVVHPEESLLRDDNEGKEQCLSLVVQQVIDDHLREPAHRSEIRDMMLEHFRGDWERIVEGHFDLSKEEFLQYRRSLSKQSLRGEYVKSFGEKLIADFLFEHDVAYKYERNYRWGEINYRPDFTIFITPESGVIIEYFGLKGDPDYDEMSAKKREYWSSKENWMLVDFTPKDIASAGAEGFRATLKASLEKCGVQCQRLSEEEIWHRVKDRAIDRFTKAIVNFIGRCRKLSLSPEKLGEMISSHNPLSSVDEMFVTLAHRFYAAYLDRLSTSGEDDFDGLLQRAASVIQSGRTIFFRKQGDGDLSALRYVFIDEFQDFSDLFYRLLCSIRERNPSAELFCVGDDWQAINGFAGSDLRFFEEFEKYIGASKRLYISTNYRSSKDIVSAGNALMAGLGKPAVPHKQSSGTVLLSDLDYFEPSFLEKERHAGDDITPAVLRVINKGLKDGHNIVILSRTNNLPYFVNYTANKRNVPQGLESFLDLLRSYFPEGLRERISISTAHKYKGLQKSMVIVIDAVSRSYPLIHPDWVFTEILGDNLEKIISEEKRLFYVALTRAAETLVIMTEGRKSPFLLNLEGHHRINPINWSQFPPIENLISRYVVKVGNQDGCGANPTYAIRDLLKAVGYQWQSTGWKGWTKSFPVEDFNIDSICSELWVPKASGVEVKIYDDRENILGIFAVDEGNWLTKMKFKL